MFLLNKLKVSSASCWFLLYGYVTMYGQQNIKQLRRFTVALNLSVAYISLRVP
jgi:hypothetical protein